MAETPTDWRAVEGDPMEIIAGWPRPDVIRTALEMAWSDSRYKGDRAILFGLARFCYPFLPREDPYRSLAVVFKAWLALPRREKKPRSERVCADRWAKFVAGYEWVHAYETERQPGKVWRRRPEAIREHAERALAAGETWTEFRKRRSPQLHLDDDEVERLKARFFAALADRRRAANHTP